MTHKLVHDIKRNSRSGATQRHPRDAHAPATGARALMPTAPAAMSATPRFAARPPGAARAARPAVSRGRAKISSVRRGVVAAASKRDDQPEDWQLKYLYDGGCTVCNSLVKLLKSKKGHEKIWCVHAPTTRSPVPGAA